MGYRLTNEQMNNVWNELKNVYDIYAPKCYAGGGRFSDTDSIRYGKVESIDEVVFDKKSEYSAKELISPNAETLFYFSEDHVNVGGENIEKKKDILILLRSCDLHAIKRFDQIYLGQGPADFYYERLRKKLKFMVMGCTTSFDNCFCVDTETNKIDTYDMSIDKRGEEFFIDCKLEQFEDVLKSEGTEVADATPSFVTETKTRVNIPESVPTSIIKNELWDQYDSRCIACGRCNFVCPTCTCFTMQDIFYTDNGKAGERRRVAASCMVDGYSDVAGGGSYRKKNGERMRYKVLHKISDYKKRTGETMCVGCGRCDDICPEYISYSNCINILSEACKEVAGNE